MKKLILLILLISFSLCSCGFNPTDDFINGDIITGIENVFDNEVEIKTDFNINFISGTSNAYVVNGSVIKFTDINEDSVYSITGSLNGNIVIDNLKPHTHLFICE